MKHTNIEEIRLAAEAAVNAANACGEEPGSEAYLKTIAREALAFAGFDPQWLPERPVSDGIVAEAMEDAEGLLLFEIDFVWAICRAMAQGAIWCTAVVPPLHAHWRHSRYHSSLGQVEKEVVRVRGCNEIDLEAWDEYVEAERLFAEVFSAALSGMADGLVDMIQAADDLRALAGDGPVNQARVVIRSATDAYFDPVGELQVTDALWATARDLGKRGIDVVAWQSEEASGRGYDLSHLRGDHEHLSGFDDEGLREVIQLPEDEKTQLFIWDSTYAGPVEMKDLRGGAGSTVAVFPAELWFRLDYTPSHYSYETPAIRMASIRSLTRKIQRGTSVNGKSLRIMGAVYDPRPGATFDITSFSYFSESDLYYVDNASIFNDGVSPRVIAEIPAGQERYTLMPEDGTVVLVARNGKGTSCYTPKRPTLISNNLFIVWPDQEKAAPEYLSCALRSTFAWSQMRSMRMPMGKADLERILIPVGSKRLMDRVVEREIQIMLERGELNYKLQLLSDEDPLDQLWAEVGPENNTPDQCNEEGGQQ